MSQVYNDLINIASFKTDDEQKRLIQNLEEYTQNVVQYYQRDFLTRIQQKLKIKEIIRGGSGIFITGNAGRGKSTIMELFMNNLHPITKKYYTFEKMIAEFYMIADHLSQIKKKVRNPFAHIAKMIGADFKILCIEDVYVKDVEQLSILYNMLTEFIKRDMTLIVTSTMHPESIASMSAYNQSCIKFLYLIHHKFKIFTFQNDVNYRICQLKKLPRLYHAPLGEEAVYYIQSLLSLLLAEHEFYSTILYTDAGTRIDIKKAYGHIVMFEFHELFDASFNAQIAASINRKFKVCIISNVPQFCDSTMQKMHDFQTFLNIAYTQRNLIIITAEAVMSQLYQGTKHRLLYDMIYDKLQTMCSYEYIHQSLKMHFVGVDFSKYADY